MKPPRHIAALANYLCEDEGGMVLLDPDFGFGDIEGPTPNIFDVNNGSEQLALSAIDRFVKHHS